MFVGVCVCGCLCLWVFVGCCHLGVLLYGWGVVVRVSVVEVSVVVLLYCCIYWVLLYMLGLVVHVFGAGAVYTLTPLVVSPLSGGEKARATGKEKEIESSPKKKKRTTKNRPCSGEGVEKEKEKSETSPAKEESTRGESGQSKNDGRGGWWLVVGVVVGGWWLVVGGWWLVFR